MQQKKYACVNQRATTVQLELFSFKYSTSRSCKQIHVAVVFVYITIVFLFRQKNINRTDRIVVKFDMKPGKPATENYNLLQIVAMYVYVFLSGLRAVPRILCHASSISFLR